MRPFLGFFFLKKKKVVFCCLFCFFFFAFLHFLASIAARFLVTFLSKISLFFLSRLETLFSFFLFPRIFDIWIFSWIFLSFLIF